MTNSLEGNGGGIPVRPLGKTGLKVSIIGFGGGHVSRPHISREQAVTLIRTAIDAGVTFMDNAWEYRDGESETRMGMAIHDRRDKVVLMTKVCARDRRGAAQQLDDSLRRLRTDMIDVWQFHECNYDNDPEWICRTGGALEAAVAARNAGKVRFIGFTGHKSPHIHQLMLNQEFEWDTVQLPVTALDRHYRSFLHQTLPELVRRDIGVIGMKGLGGDGQFIRDLGLTPAECRRYSLSQPISTLVCGIESMENLQQDIEIARSFTPMNEQEQSELFATVREQATDGRYEWYKSTQFFDSQFHRDQHGFPPVWTVREKTEAAGASPSGQ